MALIDTSIYKNPPRSLVREGLDGYSQGMQVRDQALQRRGLLEKKQREDAFRQTMGGLLGRYGDAIYTPEGQSGLVKDLARAGFPEEAVGLFGKMPPLEQSASQDPGEWRNIPGSGTLFNTRSSAIKETGAVPYQKPAAVPGQPAAPRTVDPMAEAKFNEQKRLNDARIAALNRPKPPPAPRAPSAPKGLSGDAAKLKGLVETLPGEANQLRTMITTMGPREFVTKFKLGDPKIGRLVDQVADKVGRLRSGGAVNKDEETRFKNQVARMSDVAYGNQAAMTEALDGIVNEAMIIGKAMLPPGQAPAAGDNDPLGIR